MRLHCPWWRRGARAGRGHRRRRSARRGRRWAAAPPPAAALARRWLTPQLAGLVRRLAAPRLPPQIEVPIERTLRMARRPMMAAAPSRAATPTRRRRSPQARRACYRREVGTSLARMDASRNRHEGVEHADVTQTLLLYSLYIPWVPNSTRSTPSARRNGHRKLEAHSVCSEADARRLQRVGAREVRVRLG